ncbi:acidic mammalian chitinase-like [Melitaea cinxia]|uniref:acidic mammalian chitinase-like n=1 Tax=Melitaea cinxia TaxID=113334 RepID=UPI001E271697|nr:acidic mammalian chitinase-like [Melitaea cinxia]
MLKEIQYLSSLWVTSGIISNGYTTWLTILVAVITLATPALSDSPRVVCYYTNWSVYRPGTAKFNPQNINPYLCTHLIYAFGGFTKDNTLKPFDKYQDIEKGNLLDIVTISDVKRIYYLSKKGINGLIHHL